MGYNAAHNIEEATLPRGIKTLSPQQQHCHILHTNCIVTVGSHSSLAYTLYVPTEETPKDYLIVREHSCCFRLSPPGPLKGLRTDSHYSLCSSRRRERKSKRKLKTFLQTDLMFMFSSCTCAKVERELSFWRREITLVDSHKGPAEVGSGRGNKK
jgi:hypothetical protein